MDPNNVRSKHKVPSELSLTAFLSGGLTLVLSVTYTVLGILALVYRYQCNAGLADGVTGDKYFISTLYRIYIQKASCDNPESSPPAGALLMSADTVFIFVIAVLVASVMCCAAAIALITVIAVDKTGFIFAVSWTYICICVSSLVVDITFAVFFGIDYAEMTSTMENFLPGVNINYRNDVLRLGALLFTTISLKGYLAPLISITLIILLAVYTTKYRIQLQTDEHSIHKMGAINAYEQRVNRGYMPDEEPRRSPRTRSPVRTAPITPLSDYSNSRDYDRSNSWQHSPAPRPYSYVDEPRRAPRSSPSEPQWRRDPWPPAPPMPPVPAPDYSPPARRLKSALKPNYM